MKTDWKKKKWPIIVTVAVTVLYLVANFFMQMHEKPFLLLVPVAGLTLALFVLRLEYGFLLTALFTPFAVDLALMPGMELSMPVEPMMILFCGIFFFRVLSDSNYDRRILRHPVTKVILAMIVWMTITSATSQLPDVSFKYLTARIWFLVPFYFAAVQIFRDKRRIRQFVWCYVVSLTIVIIITTWKTLGNFHDLQTLHRVMRPFYNDHTAYGCVIALFLPVVFYLFVGYRKGSVGNEGIANDGMNGWLFRILKLVVMVSLLVGLFLSYSRAAWISVLGVVAVYFAVRIGMKVKWMLLIGGICLTLFFVHQSEVLYQLGKNHQDSSYDIAGQVKSISNISTDASNVERLNRWASALRLWKEHPAVGCGPGTYQFLYAGYQRSYQLSTISTNSGNRGNAHSEYIGPLTEQGIPGVILVVTLFLVTFTTGVRVYRTACDKRCARWALAFTLSLLTYYVHGIFNNFLDTDKLSVPFWGFTAAIVALDIYNNSKVNDNEEDGAILSRDSNNI